MAFPGSMRPTRPFAPSAAVIPVCHRLRVLLTVGLGRGSPPCVHLGLRPRRRPTVNHREDSFPLTEVPHLEPALRMFRAAGPSRSPASTGLADSSSTDFAIRVGRQHPCWFVVFPRRQLQVAVIMRV